MKVNHEIRVAVLVTRGWQLHTGRDLPLVTCRVVRRGQGRSMRWRSVTFRVRVVIRRRVSVPSRSEHGVMMGGVGQRTSRGEVAARRRTASQFRSECALRVGSMCQAETQRDAVCIRIPATRAANPVRAGGAPISNDRLACCACCASVASKLPLWWSVPGHSTRTGWARGPAEGVPTGFKLPGHNSCAV